MQQKIKLTYFDFGGRAEPVRLLFYIGGVQFEDERLKPEEFFKQKTQGNFKYGQVPVLTVDGLQYAQSGAIVRFAALKSGLYPKNNLDILKVEQLSNNIDEILSKTSPTLHLKGEEQKIAREDLVKNHFPKWFSYIETDLQQNGANGYVAGSELTFADILLYGQIKMLNSGHLDHIPTNLIDKYPNIQKVIETVKNNQKVQQYYTQNPTQ